MTHHLMNPNGLAVPGIAAGAGAARELQQLREQNGKLIQTINSVAQALTRAGAIVNPEFVVEGAARLAADMTDLHEENALQRARIQLLERELSELREQIAVASRKAEPAPSPSAWDGDPETLDGYVETLR